MDNMAKCENGFGEASGYRKGGQRDVIDTLFGYLSRGTGIYYATQGDLADFCGVEVKTVRRALADKRNPFTCYRVITTRDNGICVSLGRHKSEVYRYLNNLYFRNELFKLVDTYKDDPQEMLRPDPLPAPNYLVLTPEEEEDLF